MTTPNSIYTFFNALKRHADGAIWLEKDSIHMAVPRELQNDQTRNFVNENRSGIEAMLQSNRIFSKLKFQETIIFSDDKVDSFPLSYAQQRLWFIEKYEEGSNAYHIPLTFELSDNTRSQGIKYALQKVASRHKVLRSTIHQDENSHLGIQMVQDEPVVVTERVLSDDELPRVLKTDINLPFDLGKEYPVRTVIYETLPSKRRILLINIHHIACDGWSMEVLQREMRAYYEAYVNGDHAFELPTLDIQYRDYALWQRTYLGEEVLDRQLNYWKDQLAGYETLYLPTDYTRPTRVDYRGAYEIFSLSKGTSTSLRAIAKEHGITLHSILLSSFSILLSKYTRQHDIITGSVLANRQHMQLEGLIGFLVNTRVNRVRLDDNQRFIELIKNVHRDQIAAQRYQDLPFEKLVDEMKVERDPARHPIVQVFFGLQSFGVGKDQGDYLKEFILPDVYTVEKFDLSLFIDDTSEEFIARISYATSLFSKQTIERLSRHFKDLVDQLIVSGDQPYSNISLLDEEDRNQILNKWNATDRSYPQEKTIPELFHEQVKKTPQAVALVYEGTSLTYDQLNEKSNQLAKHILAQYQEQTGGEMPRDTMIGVFMERSLEIIVGLLGILKAGGAYVPIDPAYPDERIKFMLRDTGAKIVLSTNQHEMDERIRLPQSVVVAIDLNNELYAEENPDDLTIYSKPSDLAYVIYTSGTTGQPKGVLIEHRNVLSLVFNDYLNATDQDVFAFLSSPVFDAATFEIWTPLLRGNRLVISAKFNELVSNVEAFEAFISSNKVSVLWLTKTLFESLYHLNNDVFVNLRCLIVGGEALDKNVVNQFVRQASKPRYFLNGYGPTESTTFTCTYNLLKPVESDNVPIGGPINNRKVYVLDMNLNPVPVGVAGELYIGGKGLSRGYLNNPELTAERFVVNPFAKENGGSLDDRLYKTGDLVRWHPDGNLEYIGRNDDQVKMRGFRIEPAEIEHTMLKVKGVRQACVIARERKTDTGSIKYLVGYYVQDGTTNRQTVIEALSSALPEYMVPAAFVEMRSFPMTINGKLDKRALPEETLSSDEGDYVPPSTATEGLLCEIWQQVLGIERVGVTDNFFGIGGDSILSIQVSGRLRQAGRNCQVKDIFSCKTIRRLAVQLDSKLSEAVIQSEQGVLEGAFDLLPVQQWFIHQVESGVFKKPGHWNQSSMIRIPAMGERKVAEIIRKLVDHHDVFRILYYKEASQWKQRYRDLIDIPEIRTIDVRKYDEPELEAVFTEWQSDFDLTMGPIFRAGYVHGYSDGSARLYLALHHMIVDGVSWRILTEDIKALYEGSILPAKGSSYRQWVKSGLNYIRHHSGERLYWEAQLTSLSSRYEIIHTPCTKTFELDAALTRSLLYEASGAYNTQVNDLLLTALTYALSDITGDSDHSITLEGHGREQIDPSIDHSRTMGWFTTMFPVKLTLRHSLTESIRSIKENLRSIPNKGIGFGLFATQGDGCHILSRLPLISFNYLGQFGDTASDWQLTSEKSGLSMHAGNTDRNVINVVARTVLGKISFTITTQLGGHVSSRLSDRVSFHLEEVIRHCRNRLAEVGASYTPSDFAGQISITQSLLDSLQSSAHSQQNRITHIYRANSLQQGFIYHTLTHPEDDAYRIQLQYEYDQSLDIDKYIEAWHTCIQKYPILRTAFNWQDNLLQIIYHEGNLNYELHDLTHLDSQPERDTAIEVILQDDRNRKFDLKCPTLLRLHIIKQTPDRYTVIESIHHSITDGWSNSLLLSDLHSIYQELLEYKTVQSEEEGAYVATQQYISSHLLEAHAFWKKTLVTVEEPNQMNALLSRPVDFSIYRRVESPAEVSMTIAGNDYKALKSLSLSEGITLNAIVQFSWHKLIHIYSNNVQSIVGTTVSGRDLPIEGIEKSVGLYINTLPLIVDWKNDSDVLTQLCSIQRRVEELNTHSFADLADLQRDGKRLFHTLFVFENYPSAIEQQNIRVSLSKAVEKVDYPLSLLAFEHDNTLSIRLRYDGNLLTTKKANEHCETLSRILVQIPQKLHESHRTISLLNDSERKSMVVDWNSNTVEYAQDKTYHQLFEEQARQTPQAIALVYQCQTITYQQLNEKSNQLARQIRRRLGTISGKTLASDTLIAICLERSLEMVIGMLAILKTGGAFVPIDPSYPSERIDYILKDTGAAIVLSKARIAENGKGLLPASKVALVDLKEDLYLQDATNLGHEGNSADLAYVIYTSGTTGNPKGVMVEHRNLNNLSANLIQAMNLRNNSKSTQIISMSFDAAVGEIFPVLISGGALHILSDEERFGHALLDYIDREQIDHITIPADVLNQLVWREVKSLKSIHTGGGVVAKETMALWISERMLVNVYGPTEATVCATMHVVEDEDENAIIGKPLPNTRVYVLDIDQNPVPVNVPGELYLAGAGVTRGYLNNPELTAKHFVDDPFVSDDEKKRGHFRMYKTGDLVKWDVNGNLQYLGRNDDQVKIRGFRVEPGEIEKTFQQISGVRHACVLAWEKKSDTGSIKYLVGYYIADEDLEQSYIIRKLSETLPEYMIPSAFVRMDSFPMTINGKLDKRAFPNETCTSSEDYVAPLTVEETVVSTLWQEILQVDRVGVTDDFFQRGGNSILTIRASHRMNEALGIEVQPSDIFQHRTISQLLAHTYKSLLPAIARSESKKSVLSFAQERLWFIEKYEEGSNAYHIPLAFELDSNTDLDGIKYALRKIVSRHEILRSTILQDGQNHRGIQAVQDETLAIVERILDEEEFSRVLKSDINQPFDLAGEYPIRVIVYKVLPSKRHVLLINIHHIACDGWSMEVLQREMQAYYEAYAKGDLIFDLPALEIQYRDYAAWQRRYLEGEELYDRLSYWKERLSGYEPLHLPTDYIRSAKVDYRGAFEIFSIGKTTSAKLRRLSQTHRVTLHDTLLSAFAVLLSKYTGQQDIVLGGPTANRHHFQTKNLIGFFINTQVSRVMLNDDQSFIELIGEVHRDQTAAQRYQDLPFEKLIDEMRVERDPSRHPLVQVFFGLQSFGVNQGQSNYLNAFLPPEAYTVEKFDLSLFIDDTTEELIAQISYAIRLFSKETIQRLSRHFKHLVDQLMASVDQPYSRISLLDSEERNRVLYNWNATDKSFPQAKTVHELFLEQVKRSPHAIALVYEGESWTYHQLNVESNRLARHIRVQYKTQTGTEMPPDTLIGVFMDRGMEMVVGLLGILKAGGAYVPIDPAYPGERIKFMLKDTDAKIVLSTNQYVNDERIQLPVSVVVAVELNNKPYTEENWDDLAVYSKPSDLAYVIYTSGTTGTPKGVMIEHASLCHLGFVQKERLSIGTESRVLQYSSLVFDASAWEIFSALTCGASLYIVSSNTRQDARLMCDYIADNQISIATIPQALLSVMEFREFPDLQTLVVAGETCPPEVMHRWSDNRTLINAYGPTETTVCATMHVYRQGDKNTIIGVPLPNMKAYVLDRYGSPVPPGVAGELFIGGAGLSRGYLNNPELNEKRFVDNPFLREGDRRNGHTRLYKTGDLAKWNENGDLEFVGRNDDQVKIRGFRIELGEIEHAIMKVPGVKHTCVVVRELKNGLHGKCIVGYYVAEEEPLSQSEIVAALMNQLPGHMIPAVFVSLEKLPVTVNGKVDRQALPDPEFASDSEYVEPQTETEIILSGIWQEVLGVERVGVTTDFFKIGGNSILAIQLSHRMSEALKTEVRVADIFKARRIKDLAGHVFAAQTHSQNVEKEF